MKQKVSSKLLVLFGIVCGIFFFAEGGFCATSVTNKSSTFSSKMAKTTTKSSSKTSDSALAEQIRAQRAALDSHDAQTLVAQNIASGDKGCDTSLRKCIEAKCNADYSKCATDSDITFSDKLSACKKDTNCTAHEFTLFVNEIKEDKKQEIRLSEYNKVISCGNRYNDCIITECGPKFNKCLSKSAGDKAIAACKKIATECTEADSGMTGRIGSIFGTVRQDAEIQIKADEKRLYSLRDQMRDSCKLLGALFDDRSLDCVFTASFYAGDDQDHPMASKKLYAGSVFDCTPDWFGIDVTTFKENAYRLTRSQTAASSAMLGSGLGTAVGSITSGAIDRAIDSKKAKDALEKACKENGKVLKDGKCEDPLIEKTIKKKIKKADSLTKPIQKPALTAALASQGIPSPIASIIADKVIETKDQTLNSLNNGEDPSVSVGLTDQTIGGLNIDFSSMDFSSVSQEFKLTPGMISNINNIDLSTLTEMAGSAAM